MKEEQDEVDRKKREEEEEQRKAEDGELRGCHLELVNLGENSDV